MLNVTLLNTPPVYPTFQRPPVPFPFWYVPVTLPNVPVPLNAVPVNVTVKISPPVSTVSTVIVKSFVGVTPPKNSPWISKTSPTS